MGEFYRKANKFLKLENSKEALYKAQGASTSKMNDEGKASESNKGKEKRKAEEKRTKSLKKRNGYAENKAPHPKYMNHHSLNAPVDHIYAVIDKNLYRKPEAIKNDRSGRDIKKNYAFHKDIGHNIERCMALKDEIEILIRVGYFKEFLDEPQVANKEKRHKQ